MRKIDLGSSLVARLTAGTAIAIVLAGAAHAQEGGPNTEADETVVVVGQTIEETLPQELAQYGSDVAVITSQDLREQAYVDVSSALQLETPGLFVAPRGGPFSYMDISLQGSRTQDMLFVVDNVRINNRLYNTTITDTLPASMVERVEVLKGGQSLFYGTAASSGVINVVTRGYTDELDGLFSVGLDTNEGYHVDGYVRGKAGPGNFVLYASQDQADGFETYTATQPSTTDKTRSYDVDTIGGKYRIEFSDRVSLDARYHHVDAALDYPGVSRTAFSQNVRDEDVASLAFDYEASDWAEFLVKAYYHTWDSTYTTIRNSLTTPGQLDVIDLDTYWGYEDKGINALAKFTPDGPLEYLVGYDFQQYSGSDEVLLIENQEEDVHAVFGQIRSTPDLIENGAFALGARYNDTGGVTQTVWNASGRYDFTDYFYVQANAGSSFLLPDAWNLFGNDPCCTLGNPDLEAEESVGGNIGVGGSFGADTVFSWQATYFTRSIDNLIGSTADFAAAGIDITQPFRGLSPAELAAFGRVRVNAGGEVNVDGFELIGAANFANGFSIDASYTNTSTEQENGGVAVDIDRIPEAYAKLGASYRAPSGRWGVNGSVLYTGGQLASVTGFGTVNYGDYTIVDLAAHVFLDAEEVHKLTFRLENALDEDYITRPGSSLTDDARINGTTERFYYGNRGVPQTLHVRYSFAF